MFMMAQSKLYLACVRMCAMCQQIAPFSIDLETPVQSELTW